MATDPQSTLADELVSHFMEERQHRLVRQTHNSLIEQILGHKNLMENVHSIRSRIKDPGHLKEKLLRKIRDANEKGEEFDITKENLFERINDLSGIRIIHLHTAQFHQIDTHLRCLLEDLYIDLIEGPTAKSWDPEYQKKFDKMGADIEVNDSMYTSVHYVYVSDSTKKITGEIQVRTLMEEVWGEVDHKINYPTPTKSLPCSEQIQVLARITTSATRLVDSIFASHEDHIASIVRKTKTKTKSNAQSKPIISRNKIKK